MSSGSFQRVGLVTTTKNNINVQKKCMGADGPKYIYSVLFLYHKKKTSHVYTRNSYK